MSLLAVFSKFYIHIYSWIENSCNNSLLYHFLQVILVATHLYIKCFLMYSAHTMHLVSTLEKIEHIRIRFLSHTLLLMIFYVFYCSVHSFNISICLCYCHPCINSMLLSYYPPLYHVHFFEA